MPQITKRRTLRNGVASNNGDLAPGIETSPVLDNDVLAGHISNEDGIDDDHALLTDQVDTILEVSDAHFRELDEDIVK